MDSRWIPFLLALIASGITGCALLVSERVQPATGPSAVAPATGGYYFLPKSKLRLVAERKAAKPDVSVKTEKKETTTKEAGTKSEKTNDTSTTKTEKTTNEATTTTDKTRLEGDECTVELKEIINEPDPKYMFRLNYDGSVFADDTVTVTVTPNGFINKISVTTEDKAGVILVKLADVAKAAVKGAALFAAGEPPKDLTASPAFHFDYMLDPTAAGVTEGSAEHFNGMLRQMGCNLNVEVQPPQGLIGGPPLSTANAADGIYYRPVQPYTFVIKDIDQSTEEKKKKYVNVRTTVYLPNDGPIFSLDISRASFVKKVQSIEFENGLIKQVSLTKPSQMLGAVEIPISIAQALLSLPAELFQLKVDYRTGEANVINAEKTLLDARKQFLETQEALRKLQEQIEKERRGEQSEEGSKPPEGGK